MMTMKSILFLLLTQSIMLSSFVKSFTPAIRLLAATGSRRTAGSALANSFATPMVGGGVTSLSSASSAPRQLYPSSSSSPSSSSTSRWMSNEGNGEGGPSIVDICTEKIVKALETEDVQVIGAYDDPNGSHISIVVYSELFEGKRPVQRQQLVYKALWEELQGAVHAVDSMVCKTPAEK